MIFSITVTSSHPLWEESVIKSKFLEGPSKTAVLKAINVNSKQKCDLKNRGTTHWVDKNEVTHLLELKEESIQ